jgi:hypothetical protein
MSLVEGAELSATYVSNATLNGTIVYPPSSGGQGDQLSFIATWMAASETAPTLADIASTYSGAFYATVNTGENDTSVPTATLTISASGALSGTVACFGYQGLGPACATPACACTVSGTVAARADVDAYDVALSFANGATGTPGTGSLPGGWAEKTATGMAFLGSSKLVIGVAAPDNTAFAFSGDDTGGDAGNDAGSSTCATTLCGGVCCASGYSCVNSLCCLAALACGTAADPLSACCPAGDSCVAGACCPGSQSCGSSCCLAGETCIAGPGGGNCQ